MLKLNKNEKLKNKHLLMHDKDGNLTLKGLTYYCLIGFKNFMLTLGMLSLIYSVYLSFNTTSQLDVNKNLDMLKNSYISALDVEAQITIIPEKKNKLLVSLVEDGSKFWLVDKNEFATKKEDFERITIIVDSEKSNILKGEQYKLDSKYYNLVDSNVNTDNLRELSYTEYKTIESDYIDTFEDSRMVFHCRIQGLIYTILGVFLYVTLNIFGFPLVSLKENKSNSTQNK